MEKTPEQLEEQKKKQSVVYKYPLGEVVKLKHYDQEFLICNYYPGKNTITEEYNPFYDLLRVEEGKWIYQTDVPEPLIV